MIIGTFFFYHDIQFERWIKKFIGQCSFIIKYKFFTTNIGVLYLN